MRIMRHYHNLSSGHSAGTDRISEFKPHTPCICQMPRYSSMGLIHTLGLTMLLRDSSRLKEVVIHAIKLVLAADARKTGGRTFGTFADLVSHNHDSMEFACAHFNDHPIESSIMFGHMFSALVCDIGCCFARTRGARCHLALQGPMVLDIDVASQGPMALDVALQGSLCKGPLQSCRLPRKWQLPLQTK
jgi:hypothetical protein